MDDSAACVARMTMDKKTSFATNVRSRTGKVQPQKEKNVDKDESQPDIDRFFLFAGMCVCLFVCILFGMGVLC